MFMDSEYPQPCTGACSRSHFPGELDLFNILTNDDVIMKMLLNDFDEAFNYRSLQYDS